MFEVSVEKIDVRTVTWYPVLHRALSYVSADLNASFLDKPEGFIHFLKFPDSLIAASSFPVQQTTLDWAFYRE